jgi:hypothetical protein
LYSGNTSSCFVFVGVGLVERKPHRLALDLVPLLAETPRRLIYGAGQARHELSSTSSSICSYISFLGLSLQLSHLRFPTSSYDSGRLGP